VAVRLKLQDLMALHAGGDLLLLRNADNELSAPTRGSQRLSDLRLSAPPSPISPRLSADGR